MADGTSADRSTSLLGSGERPDDNEQESLQSIDSRIAFASTDGLGHGIARRLVRRRQPLKVRQRILASPAAIRDGDVAWTTVRQATPIVDGRSSQSIARARQHPVRSRQTAVRCRDDGKRPPATTLKTVCKRLKRPPARRILRRCSDEDASRVTADVGGRARPQQAVYDVDEDNGPFCPVLAVFQTTPKKERRQTFSHGRKNCGDRTRRREQSVV